MITGKAFEYALLVQFAEKLTNKTEVSVIKNSSFFVVEDCFGKLEDKLRSQYVLSASFAVNFLIDIEPHLSNGVSSDDLLELEIVPDSAGELGDVRDVLAIRLLQKWEIGISAKNNHRAVKPPRLSSNIDFGNKWLGVKCSQDYFEAIKPIFESLKNIQKEYAGEKHWSDMGDYHSTVYVPVLEAFKEELERLYQTNPEMVAHNLVSYLVGKKDFYKVIRGKGGVEIQAYNLHGTLNLPFKDILPKYQTPQTPLPSKIVDISFQANTKTTIIVTMNNGWVLSFRIHNASSRVEPSLKFDVNLVSAPKQLFINTLNIQ